MLSYYCATVIKRHIVIRFYFLDIPISVNRNLSVMSVNKEDLTCLKRFHNLYSDNGTQSVLTITPVCGKTKPDQLVLVSSKIKVSKIQC